MRKNIEEEKKMRKEMGRRKEDEKKRGGEKREQRNTPLSPKERYTFLNLAISNVL